MRILLDAICRAGLNRGRIRDSLTGTQTYEGATGDMVFDPNCKNIAPCTSLVCTMAPSRTVVSRWKTYAGVGENGVQYAGPKVPDEAFGDLKFGVFGPHADELVRSSETLGMLSEFNVAGKHLSLIAIPSETSWGKASDELVKAVYQNTFWR